MARTAEWEIGCYGMTALDVSEHLKPQAELVGKRMLLMSMLSDVQELIARERGEEARQLINRTKWVLQNIEN